MNNFIRKYANLYADMHILSIVRIIGDAILIMFKAFMLYSEHFLFDEIIKVHICL